MCKKGGVKVGVLLSVCQAVELEENPKRKILKILGSLMPDGPRFAGSMSVSVRIVLVLVLMSVYPVEQPLHHPRRTVLSCPCRSKSRKPC